MKGLTTPDNRVIQYAYDNDSRLTQITPQAGQVFAFTYDNADRRTALSYPNGVNAAYAYDTRSRLTSLEYRTSGNSVIDTFTYTLDAVGNRLTRADNEYQYAYTYDPTYRLTQSQPTLTAQNPIFSQSTEAFTYDAVGNRLIGPAYPKANTFIQSYSYDFENRIASATRQVTGNPNADTITFKYDPFGRRVEKNVATYENGTPTTYKYTYVYDNEDIILEVLERTQNGNTTTTTTAYTHGPGIDEPLSLMRDAQTYYYHADGLGSITSITDSTQTVVNRYAYDSFGAPKSSETIRNAYTYTGREYDSETGLYYYRARYYDPEAGRFVSKDPIGFAGGDVNVYGYVGSRPVNFVDPTGLFVYGIYNQGTGQLFLYDVDTGKSMSAQFFSGGSFGAPIPNGRYDILGHGGRQDFYRLEPVDTPYGNDTQERTGRDAFRLHKPGGSFGCITASDRKAWQAVKSFIEQTQALSAQVPSQWVNPIKRWLNPTETLPWYGRIIVQGSY